MPRVLILLHESDPYPRRQGFAIWTLVERWSGWGIEVEVTKGIDHSIEADLTFPHVVQTVMPEEYRAFIETFPRVINRGAYDISKRRISTLLVGAQDTYDGPVIVKTNLNYGGLQEWEATGRIAVGGFARRLRLWVHRHRRPNLAKARSIPPRSYPIFDTLQEVPESVFANPWLVVEKFMPERNGELYFAEAYHFFGDRSLCRRLASRSPIVKEHESVVEEVEPHPDIVAERHRIGLDYGKMDYVIHDGRAILLDTNLTVGLSRPDRAAERADRLAPGIWGFLS